MVPVHAGLLEDVATRDEIALRVARDLVGEPLRVRFAADHDEQRGRGHLLDGVVRAIGKR